MIMGGRQTGLGRGLGALIPPKPAAKPVVSIPSPVDDDLADADIGIRPNTATIHQIPVHMVDPNPHQPRKHFDHTQLEDLINSIQVHGVLQPIVVTPKSDGRFELIAGERRLRASKIAGLETIPANVRTASEQQKLELAMIENIQRQELNALEEARSYLSLQNEFSLTQEDIAKRVGKSRSQVANTIRLLQLPEAIQYALIQGKISASNARTLLSLPSEDERIAMFRVMLEGNFTVRQTEARVPHKRGRSRTMSDPNVASAEEKLRSTLGSKVVIKRDVRGQGEIKIIFLNDEDFGKITRKIAGEE